MKRKKRLYTEYNVLKLRMERNFCGVKQKLAVRGLMKRMLSK